VWLFPLVRFSATGGLVASAPLRRDAETIHPDAAQLRGDWLRCGKGLHYIHPVFFILFVKPHVASHSPKLAAPLEPGTAAMELRAA
jgi:hypothetical protein